ADTSHLWSLYNPGATDFGDFQRHSDSLGVILISLGDSEDPQELCEP
ncbi:MAG: hypothetical protein RL242_1138, partial [Pseudomonadota bacterium]